VAQDPALILQVPAGGAVELQLSAEPLPLLARGEVVLESGVTDALGNLEASAAGEVVLALASPEALRRDPAEVHRVIAHAGPGTEPLVVTLEAAEELREDELAALVEAAAHTPRAVILRIVRSS
jgi:hypothetical protein